MSFASECIYITGIGSGIGRSLAGRLIGEGANICGIDRSEELLKRLHADIPSDKLATHAADVTNGEALTAAIGQLEANHGPADRLIACAGIGRMTSVTPFSAAEFTEVVQVNLLGVANAVGAVLPGMIARGRGHIIGLSSLASFRGLPRMAAYCASKSGLNAFLDALAIDLRTYQIQVSTICPGFIRTPMTEAFGDQMPEMLDLEDAVTRILRAIRRRKRFAAFPARPATLLRFLRMLPIRWADQIVFHGTRNTIARVDPSGTQPPSV